MAAPLIAPDGWIRSHPSHFKDVETDGFLSEMPAEWRDETNKAAVTQLHHNARTLMFNSRPIAVIGIRPIWDHVAEAWAVISQEAMERHSLSLCRGTKEYLDAITKTDDLWRVQAYFRERGDAGIRWIEFLGFNYEGRMRCFGQDHTTYWLFARIR